MTSLSKNRYLVLGIGALFIAGLFLFWPNKQVDQTNPSELKPSQLDFSTSNQIQPPSYPGDQANSERELPKQIIESQSLPSQDQEKWQSLVEILASKNDNDPRIDSELKVLSAELHDKLRKTYHELPKEDRNGRGMMVFLIARDLKIPEDAEFLKTIYQERPCLSFENCEASSGGQDPHLSGLDQTSLNYPQIAGLYQLEKRLERDPQILQVFAIRRQLSEALREARQFPSDAVQKKAEQIQKKYNL